LGSFDNLEIQGYYIISIFLCVLIIGFIYEWLKGALTWE
jgi:NADH:ubiquinone oxidoreductase subunit 3 (subunit A)